MKAPPPPYFDEPPASESPESDEAPTWTKVYKAYWGVLSETLLTWTMAVAAARNTKWFSARVYYSSLSFSSKRYYFGLGRCSAYGDVDSEDVDDACILTQGARACQILATLVISAVLIVVLRAAISPAPRTGTLGLHAGLMLAVFSVLELGALYLAASYASKVGSAYDDDSSDSFSLGATFFVAAIACLLGMAGSIASLVLRKRATADQDGPLAKLATAQVFANFTNVVREPDDSSNGRTQATQRTNSNPVRLYGGAPVPGFL